ncbi:MAG: hypothetical protein NT080_05020 [Spirochaetes bacterium]|nr:hypothetical protein [Spirochaetota bacterium]
MKRSNALVALLALCLLACPAIAQGKPSVASVTFASELLADGTPKNPGTQFTVASLSTLHALVDFSGFTAGMKVTETWTRGGETVRKREYSWEGWAKGVYDAVLERPESGFVTGAYLFAISADGVPLIVKEFSVLRERRNYPGIAVPLRGKVVDAATGKPIAGATIGILEPGVLFEQWRKDDSLLLTGSLSDVAGNFQFPVNLPRGLSYGIFVEAMGYEAIYSELGLQVAPTQVNPVIITIRVQRLQF